MILLKACFNIENLTMDFKISETNKMQQSLIYESFVFRIDNVLKSSDISWWCTNRSCKARLRTDSAISTIIPINLSHSHDINERKVERQQLRTLVKQKGARILYMDTRTGILYHYCMLYCQESQKMCTNTFGHRLCI